jgi:CheY-like chemotaxis protein
MIEQILMNLIVNARDAMPNGGELFISAEAAVFDERTARQHPEARAGDFVRLSVRDTGCGMQPETLKRIFEPFFTTKESGKGTGLGLATVYGIVKQHQGWVEVTSAPGRGTAFQIYLPAISSPSVEEAGAAGEAPIRGGTETILLVEDDESVRLLVNRVLKNMGYKIYEAVSGKAALEVWQARGSEIDLLLTDIVMPDGMTGQDLAERLRPQKPGLKVILSSGHSHAATGKDTDFFRRNRSHFLQKPYSSRALAQLVRECLDGD